MGVTTTQTNKPFNPRGNDQSPKGYNRASLFSGKALDFDGVNDSVDIGQNLAFINTGDFTFLANAKFDVLSGDECIMGQGSAGAGLAVLALVNGNGFFRFAFYGDDLDWDEPVETGKWYSLAFTFNRTTKARAIYVNGQLAVSDVSTLTPNASSNNFVIGKVPYSATYADAQITGVRAFNTALTAEQIADLYNNPEKVVPTGLESNLKLWLPMMEGAGTTAYDGSGNGNHGTISGATYVNGIGAPVAQSAVINWNKGGNILDNSENFDAWLKNAGNTITSNSIAAPDGLTTADTISSPVSSQINQHQVVSPLTSGADYVFSVWLKKKTTSEIQIYQYSTATPIGFVSRATINFDSGTITDVEGSGATIEEYTNGWFRCAIYCTAPSTSLSHGIYTAAAGVADVYAWGGQSEQSDTLGPYVRTGATAQTSEVLLPQGLTTGRDITGVNLFENVRKQGALNLDGKSWAEVHDNESLDITDAITLEAWYYNDGVNATKIIQGRWSNQVDMSYLMYLNNSNLIFVGHSGSGTFGGNASTTSLASNQYSHVAITYDKSYLKYYINGSLVDTFTFTVSLNPNATVVLDIGRNDGRSGVYTGSNYNDTPIAQPRIYNRALTAEEVQRSYDSNKNTYTNS